MLFNDMPFVESESGLRVALILVEQTKVCIIVALVGGEGLKITDGPA